MEVRETTLGDYPCLVAGSGPPLILLAGLSPDAGVAHGAMRRTHESEMKAWARSRTVYYCNRRPGLPAGLTMSALAAEQAVALRESFAGPVDVLGSSTGGSIAQQLAAEHPDVVRRLALLSTACRLGPVGRRDQRRVAARLRAGALRRAGAVGGAALTPPGPARPVAAVLGWWLGPRVMGPGAADTIAIIDAEDAFDLARLPAITAPTVLVAGGRDRFYSRELFEETARLIPGCRLELFARRGHVTVATDRRAIATILGFLGAGR